MNATRSQFQFGLKLAGAFAAICALGGLAFYLFCARVVILPTFRKEMPLGGVLIVWRQNKMERCQMFETLHERMYPQFSTDSTLALLENQSDEARYDKYNAAMAEGPRTQTALLADLQNRSILRLPASKMSWALCKL